MRQNQYVGMERRNSVRADLYLAQHGYAKSRQRAQELIRKGLVFCNGKTVEKPSVQLYAGDDITVCGDVHGYVGRGGLKLAAALARFSIDPTGRRCCDIGASTGGFTDCLLQHGAAFVYAVDSGRDQLDPSLRADKRVCSLERCNARTLTADMLAGAVSLCVMDVSFTSAMPLFPAVARILCAGGDYILLIKPQFEVGRGNIGKGGIVHNRTAAVQSVRRLVAAAQTYGLFLHGLFPSPITGGDGNVEFLAQFQKEVPSSYVLPDTQQDLLSLLYE